MTADDDDLLPPNWHEDKEKKGDELEYMIGSPDNKLQHAVDTAIETALERKKAHEIEQLNRALEGDDGE